MKVLFSLILVSFISSGVYFAFANEYLLDEVETGNLNETVVADQIMTASSDTGSSVDYFTILDVSGGGQTVNSMCWWTLLASAAAQAANDSWRICDICLERYYEHVRRNHPRLGVWEGCAKCQIPYRDCRAGIHRSR
ncbi:MAG: hypothetical protein HY606_01165 [Planctomycetes bacterium]|nr:hypothetical protein [Planctomycetota bacterium]